MALGKRNIKWLYTIFLLLVFPLTAMSSDTAMTPERIRALYMIQMTKFVQVGNPAHKMKTICYYEKKGMPEDKSVGQILEKYVASQPNSEIIVKGFHDIHDFAGCDSLYIPAYEDSEIDDVIAVLGSASTLTLSPAKRFIYRGGMIGFITDDSSHIQLEINMKNIQANGVWVDSQLLEIMHQIIRP